MSKEVVVKKAQELAVSEPSQYAGMGIEEMSLNDMTISKIHLLQSTSALVKDRKGFAGDFVDMTSGEKLGDTENPISIIPFHFSKEFLVEIQDGQKFKFLKKEAYNKETAFREVSREQVINGVMHRWVLCINVYVMLEKDLGNPAAFPFMMTFKMTALKTGKDLFSNALKASKSGLPIWAVKTTIKSVNTDNDKGSWSAWSLSAPSVIPNHKEYDLDFVTWINMIKSGTVKTNESVEEDVTPF